MEKRKFTINVPNVGKTDFNRLSASLKRHLRSTFPEEPPVFLCPAQPKATLHLTVKPKHAKTTLRQIMEWCSRNPEIEFLIDGKLQKIAVEKTRVLPLNATGSKKVPRRLPDKDFVEEESAGRGPGRLPDDDFVLEAFSRDTPSLIPDDEFVEEEE
jgi:hypothetical protein